MYTCNRVVKLKKIPSGVRSLFGPDRKRENLWPVTIAFGFSRLQHENTCFVFVCYVVD